MRNFQTIARSLPIIDSTSWIGLCLLTVAVLIVSPLPVFAQSTTAQSAPAASSQSAASSQTQAPAQADSSTQSDSLADAARKAKAQAQAQKNKTAAKPAHVFTDDNISSVGGTISVVGDSSSAGGGHSNADYSGDSASSSGSSDEQTWRARAAQIKDQIAAVDQQITQMKSEISKQGGVAFDPNAGLSQGVIVIHDRNADLKKLEDQKASLEKQLDDLADQARKAGADPGWVR